MQQTPSSHNPGNPIINFEQVAFAFGSLPVHKSVSFAIYPGEIVTILGPSGTGKTVLLKLMIGLFCAQSGLVSVEGKDLSKMTEEELRQVRRNIGMLFQGAALFDSLTVAENIAFPLREYGYTDDNFIASTVSRVLALVDLPEMGAKLPGELSGGQRKRIGLARALSLEPRVLLFDEPTTGLDPTSRRKIDDLILRLKREAGVTSVLVTHDMDSAVKLSDRIILIDSGIVRVEGPASQLWEQNNLVKAFHDGRWEQDEHDKKMGAATR